MAGLWLVLDSTYLLMHCWSWCSWGGHGVSTLLIKISENINPAWWRCRRVHQLARFAVLCCADAFIWTEEGPHQWLSSIIQEIEMYCTFLFLSLIYVWCWFVWNPPLIKTLNNIKSTRDLSSTLILTYSLTLTPNLVISFGNRQYLMI